MKKSSTLLLVLGQFLFSCVDVIESGQVQPIFGGMNDLLPPAGFIFLSESSSTFEASFEGFAENDQLMIALYDGNPDQKGNQMSRIVVSSPTFVERPLMIPNHVDVIYAKVSHRGNSLTYPLPKSATLALHVQASDFFANADSHRARTAAPTGLNLIENGDFELYASQRMTQYSQTSPITAGAWFTSSDWRREALTVNIDNDQNLLLKSILQGGRRHDHEAVYAINVSDPQRGQDLTVAFDLKRTTGDNYLLFRVEQLDAQGNTLSSEEVYPAITETWESFSHHLLVSEEAAQVRVWFSSQTTNGNVYVDNVIATSSLLDYDGDGVHDEYDVAPFNATITQAAYYPAENQQATIAFEDMWPYQGDYDFNDFVATYNTSYLMNHQSEVVRVLFNVDVKAIGGTFNNDFCLNIVDPAHTATVMVLEKNVPFKTINLEGKTEIRFQEIKQRFNSTAIVNTLEGSEKLAAVHLTIQVDLMQGIPYTDMKSDLYLRIDQQVGREVHVLGGEPTSLADPSWFGLGDDGSSPAENFFYASQQQLPWALNIPTHWDYPQEGIELTRAYPDFVLFAQQNQRLDWYSTENPNRVLSRTYQK